MGGDDHRVHLMEPVGVVAYLDPVPMADHRANRCADPHRGELVGDALDVAVRSADHGLPRRRAADGEHAVVVEKLEQIAGRVLGADPRAGRPHGRDQRHHEVVHEVPRVPAGGEERAQTQAAVGHVVGPGLTQQPAGSPVESGDLSEHPQKPRPGKVARCGEQPAGAAAPRVFQSTSPTLHAHRHLRVLCGHSQLGEQAHQVRVGLLVVHDEA
jgi:hypothetical protein